jgi:hypothetical protein
MTLEAAPTLQTQHLSNYTVPFNNSQLSDIVWSGDVSTLSKLMDVEGVPALTENNMGATATTGIFL